MNNRTDEVARDRGRGVALPDDPLPVDHTQAILETTKHVAALLKEAECPFALAGSVAAHAYGVPAHLQHDTDFYIRREDAEAVAGVLKRAGLDIRQPPEDWLFKARCGGEEIDLIFEPAQGPVTSDMLGRAHTLPVDSVHMPVLAPDDLMCGLLSSLSEHHCDFGALLPVARTLRERIDWDTLRHTYENKPMPDAFIYLLERLGVIERREEKP